MIYEYYCERCVKMHDVEKSLSQLNRKEFCPSCSDLMDRRLSAKVSFRGEKADSNEAYFHPSLGCVVKSDKHAAEIAKSQGLIEIGNESQNHMRPKEKAYDLTDNEYHDVMGVGEV